MPITTRRNFIKTTSAGILSGPLIISGVRGQTAPSNTIRHAVIGTGGRGGRHVKAFAEAKGCQLVAVCDVDPVRLGKSTAALPNKNTIKKYSDFRKLLEDKSIDSVSIATPDHWHTPVALWALMAGKHVYLENPAVTIFAKPTC